jgi:uncharacterized protein (TIGR02996 family)
MSTRAGLIAAILANPADDTPRLVFADYLQENGEIERAEFIRLHIEAAGEPNSKAGKRAAAILKKRGRAWRKLLGLRDDAADTYDRGFLTDVTLMMGGFAEHTAAALAIEPVFINLRVHGWLEDLYSTPVTNTWTDGLAANPHLKAVTRITGQGGGFEWGEDVLESLMRSPHLGNLKRLAFVGFDGDFGIAGVKSIAESPSPFVLEHLNLNESLGWQDDEQAGTVTAVKLIATSPRFASLQSLRLTRNGLGERSAKALLASKTLPRTMHLDVTENPCEEDYGEALAERFTGVSDGVDDDEED